jgi:hypothetical protein
MEQLPFLLVRGRRAGQGRRVIVSHPFLMQLQTSKAQLLQKRMGHPISFLSGYVKFERLGPPAIGFL